MTDLISREELKTKLDRGDSFFLVDTLPESAYRKGHLPGAINIVSDDIRTVAPKQIPDRDTEIVVYCASIAELCCRERIPYYAGVPLLKKGHGFR